VQTLAGGCVVIAPVAQLPDPCLDLAGAFGFLRRNGANFQRAQTGPVALDIDALDDSQNGVVTQFYCCRYTRSYEHGTGDETD